MEMKAKDDVMDIELKATNFRWISVFPVDFSSCLTSW